MNADYKRNTETERTHHEGTKITKVKTKKEMERKEVKKSSTSKGG
jgi:hypothetical protein